MVPSAENNSRLQPECIQVEALESIKQRRHNSFDHDPIWGRIARDFTLRLDAVELKQTSR